MMMALCGEEGCVAREVKWYDLEEIVMSFVREGKYYEGGLVS